MELGARNGCVVADTLRDKMLILDALGYDFMELALRREENDAIDEAFMESMLKMSEETGLPIKATSMGHFGGFARLNEADRVVIVEHVIKMIDLTAKCGGDVILLATSEQELDVSGYAEVYREEMKKPADYAEENGVILALEHVGKYTPSAVGNLVRAIDHDAIRVYYDMGNCFWTGEEPVEQAVNLGDIIAAIHIKGGRQKPLMEMPLVEIREALESHNYKGRGCLEIGGKLNNDHLKEAMQILRKAGY